MTLAKILWLAFRGALVGMALAMLAPAGSVNADGDCICAEAGEGNYACASRECIPGGATCVLMCG